MVGFREAFALFFLFSFFDLGVAASREGSSPWQRQSTRQSPWGSARSTDPEVSSTRAQNRENFFNRLGQQVASQSSRPSNYRKVPVTDLKQLPWDSYAKEWDSKLDEDFLWPVAGGKISSGYGLRHGKIHEGLDIKGGAGEEIRAVAAGKVVFEGWLSGYGKTLVIAHGNGISTIYAHNKTNLVSRGQEIQKGQAIAHVGSTGRATGPHLHFEVRKDGKALNPLRFHYKGQWDDA